MMGERELPGLCGGLDLQSPPPPFLPLTGDQEPKPCLQLLVPDCRLTKVSVPQAIIRKKLSLLRRRPSLYS
jgi:hypothetical protein